MEAIYNPSKPKKVEQVIVDPLTVKLKLLADKHFDQEEMNMLEDMAQENRGRTMFKDFGKNLKYFKRSGTTYKKITSKVYNSIQLADSNSNTKNLSKILQ